MNWITAKKQLQERIKVGAKFDENSDIREVLEIPSIESERFKIRISKAGTTIFIPMIMLEEIFEETIKNKNTYNKSVIFKLYPKEVKTHSCYVHVVGQLFKFAGVMDKINSRNFRVIK